MAKFHLNGKGDPGQCTAREGNCPFGGDEVHYPTPDAARAAFELSMAHESQLLTKVSKEQPVIEGLEFVRALNVPEGVQENVPAQGLNTAARYLLDHKKLGLRPQSVEYTILGKDGEVDFKLSFEDNEDGTWKGTFYMESEIGKPDGKISFTSDNMDRVASALHSRGRHVYTHEGWSMQDIAENLMTEKTKDAYKLDEEISPFRSAYSSLKESYSRFTADGEPHVPAFNEKVYESLSKKEKAVCDLEHAWMKGRFSGVNYGSRESLDSLAWDLAMRSRQKVRDADDTRNVAEINIHKNFAKTYRGLVQLMPHSLTKNVGLDS